MPQFNYKPAYEREEDFSEHLSEWLDGKHLRTEYGKVQIDSIHQPEKENGEPDIALHFNHALQTKERHIEPPLYIECKIGGKFSPKTACPMKEVQKNLEQFIRYKYVKDGHRHIELTKYGDHHIAAAAPLFLTEAFDPRDFESGHMNPAQFIRTLWHLGIGIIHGNDPAIAFNEAEVVNIV